MLMCMESKTMHGMFFFVFVFFFFFFFFFFFSGNLKYQLTQLGTSYVWSGVIDMYEIKNLEG